jgi:hypothetical protein
MTNNQITITTGEDNNQSQEQREVTGHRDHETGNAELGSRK